MKLLKRLAGGTQRERKMSVQITRLLTPLILALIAFGVVGFINSGQSSAHAASTCSNVVRDSETIITYFGDNVGTIQLTKNSCTGLFQGKVICSALGLGPVTLSLAAVQVPYSTYNTVNGTCSQAGQVIETAPHVYVQAQDFFCATADIITYTGGSGVACTTQP